MILFDSLNYHIARPAAIFGRGSELMSGEPVYEGGYQEGSVESVFGYGSTIPVSCADVDIAEPSLVTGVLFQIFLVVTLIVYLYMLLRSNSFVGPLLSGVVGAGDERRMASDSGEIHLARFKDVATVIGVVLLALIGVRYVDGVLPANARIYMDERSVYAPVAALILVGSVIAWHYALHKVVEWVSRREDIAQLAAVSRMNFVRMVVVLYPLVAIWLNMPNDDVRVWATMLVVCFTALLIIYLKDTFLFFVAKKISILYWILYLCTAILLPLSFMCVILPSQVM